MSKMSECYYTLNDDCIFRTDKAFFKENLRVHDGNDINSLVVRVRWDWEKRFLLCMTFLMVLQNDESKQVQ